MKRGKLQLSGTPVGGNKYGTAFCLRPQATNYFFETQITNKNTSIKGLTMYGDDKNLLIFGVSGNKLIVKSVKNNVERLLSESPFTNKNLHLKIEVRDGCKLTFLSSTNGRKWNRVLQTDIDVDYLTRWDRVARPGLIHVGELSNPAEFSFFKMEKL